MILWIKTVSLNKERTMPVHKKEHTTPETKHRTTESPVPNLPAPEEFHHRNQLPDHRVGRDAGYPLTEDPSWVRLSTDWLAGQLSTSLKGWIRGRWCSSAILCNNRISMIVFLRSCGTPGGISPFCLSLWREHSLAFFACFFPLGFYTKLGMVSVSLLQRAETRIK